MKTTFLLLMPVFALVSCAPSLPSTGFLGEDDKKLTADKSLPFQRSWRKADADLSKYSKIEVVPIRTDKLRSLDNSLNAVNFRNIGDQYSKDVAKLADGTTEAFRKELDELPGRSATIVSKPSKSRNTLVLETNLVEAIPGRPSAKIANLAVPLVGILSQPSIAIEGRLRDARSGETLLAFADNETPEASIIDAQSFTFYGTLRREAEKWASQLAEIIEGSTDVKDPFFFRPVDW
ncbi:DUF3313 family protein [Akkermansiaceae bacterium]|nr:DUF3313 family protein [Akkermansiaceae bacterium]